LLGNGKEGMGEKADKDIIFDVMGIVDNGWGNEYLRVGLDMR